MNIRMQIVPQIAVKLNQRLIESDIDWRYDHAKCNLTFNNVNTIRLSQDKDTWVFHLRQMGMSTCEDISIHKDNILDFEVFE